MTPALSIDNLSVDYLSRHQALRAVDQVSLQVQPGEILAVVGESGCGKSTLAKAMMGLFADNKDVRVEGRVELAGQSLLELSGKQLAKLRGDNLAMVFQDPMSSLNPVIRIGKQVGEVPRLHHGDSWSAARDKAGQQLAAVGIPSARKRLDQFPHQFSGGMRQRVMIAMATIGQPDLLIADEPTTALDVTVQGQILKLLVDMVEEQDCGLLFITHDLAVVAQIADRVAVMYAGRIAEEGAVADVFAHPTHPYTEGLLGALPTGSRQDLVSIPGQPPDLADLAAGCHFEPRCPLAVNTCKQQQPPLEGQDGHRKACWEREVDHG